MTIIGLDVSLTSTGVAVYRGGEIETQTVKSKPQGTGVSDRMWRFDCIVGAIDDVMRGICPTVFLEGYAYGAKGKSVMQIGELGGLIRHSLCCAWSLDVYEVPPSTLKKFVAGRGNADKIAVATALLRRYGVEFPNSDEADAYGLARFGACVLGLEEPATQSQRGVVEKFRETNGEGA